MTENELYHYGVKGMKWGVRRYEKSGGSYTKAGVKRFNESANTYDTARSLYKTLKKNKKEKEILSMLMLKLPMEERLLSKLKMLINRLKQLNK